MSAAQLHPYDAGAPSYTMGTSSLSRAERVLVAELKRHGVQVPYAAEGVAECVQWQTDVRTGESSLEVESVRLERRSVKAYLGY